MRSLGYSETELLAKIIGDLEVSETADVAVPCGISRGLRSLLIHSPVEQLNGRLTINSGGGLSSSVSFSDSHIERRV